MLNEFANSLSKPTTSGSNNDASTIPNSKESVNNFLDFLNVYEKRLEELDNQKFQLNQQIEENKQKFSIEKANLNRLNISDFNETMYDYHI